MDDMDRNAEINEFVERELQGRLRQRLDEQSVNAGKLAPYDNEGGGVLPVPWTGNRSDGEIYFSFESEDEARALFDFMVGASTGVRLVEPGLVNLYVGQGQYTVHFLPSVMVYMPEVIEAAVMAYRGVVWGEGLAFESLDEFMTVIDEAKKPESTRDIKRKGIAYGVPGNPYHSKDDGMFTSKDATKKGGSWSKGGVQRKMTSKGNAEITVKPCGRKARGESKNWRCWDGAKLSFTGQQMSKILKKQIRREDMDYGDAVILKSIAKMFEARIAKGEGRE